MSTAERSDGLFDDVPVVQGAVVGVGAFVIAYVLTAILAGIGTRDSGVDVSPLEGIGWFFYSAHYVDIVAAGDTTIDVFTNSTIPQIVFTFAPVLVLIGAGFVLTWRFTDGRSLGDGVKAGVAVVFGYLPLVLLDTLVLRGAVAETAFEPDLLPAVVLAGIAFPLVLGAVGGVVAARSQ